MSQTHVFNPGDSIPQGETVHKSEARQTLSSYAVDTAIKEGAKSLAGKSEAKAGGEKSMQSGKGSAANESDMFKYRNFPNGEGLENRAQEGNFAKAFRPVTEKERAEAKDLLTKDLSALIPEQDRKDLKSITDSLIDGKLDKLSDSLKALSGDPARMEKLLKGAEEQLQKHGSDLHIQLNKDGNVLVYHGSGQTALSINAKTGESTLHPIERQGDGSIVLKPGEIVNRTPAEMMQKMGDSTVRDLLYPWSFGDQQSKGGEQKSDQFQKSFDPMKGVSGDKSKANKGYMKESERLDGKAGQSKTPPSKAIPDHDAIGSHTNQ